jgi:hypothetical protein
MEFPDDESTGPTDPFLGGMPDEKDRRSGIAMEFMKKMAVAGLGAIFMTEEGIRNLAGQLKLPKEVLGLILTQAEKTKDDLGRVVSEELRRFLQSDKLRDEFLKLMSGMTVEIKAQVRLVPESSLREGEAKPAVKITEISAKRAKRGSKKGE